MVLLLPEFLGPIGMNFMPECNLLSILIMPASLLKELVAQFTGTGGAVTGTGGAVHRHWWRSV
jgi:hypothetical protein